MAPFHTAKKMPRIPLITPETLTEAQRPVYDKIVSGPRGKIQGPLRAALHNPELADRWQALGELLRYRTTLSPRLSELAILVTAVARQSPFEWYAHRIEGEKVGLESAILDALLAGREPPGMSADDALVYQFARELNELHSVRDATYACALERFGAKTLVELTALVGYYTMVALTLNAHEIPLPPGVEAVIELPQRRGEG